MLSSSAVAQNKVEVEEGTVAILEEVEDTVAKSASYTKDILLRNSGKLHNSNSNLKSFYYVNGALGTIAEK